MLIASPCKVCCRHSINILCPPSSTALMKWMNARASRASCRPHVLPGLWQPHLSLKQSCTHPGFPCSPWAHCGRAQQSFTQAQRSLTIVGFFPTPISKLVPIVLPEANRFNFAGFPSSFPKTNSTTLCHFPPSCLLSPASEHSSQELAG